MIIGFILSFIRKKNKRLLKTTYHELGHLYVALLFDNFIPVTQLVIGKKGIEAKTGNKDWNGGVAYNINKSNFNDVNFVDQFIAVALAGMCSQNLFFTSREEFKIKIPLFVLNPDKYMNNEGGIPDWVLAKSNLISNSGKLGIPITKYREEIMMYIFSYLSNDEVWYSIDLFANILLKRRKMALNRIEINSIINKINYDDFLNRNRINIINERYPL
jgi:hypothetical protein